MPPNMTTNKRSPLFPTPPPPPRQTGYIKTSFGALLIEPVNRTSSDEVLHRVWRRSKRHARQAVSKLELGLDALERQTMVQTEARNLIEPRRLTRRKRHYNDMDSQVYTLEVLIAVDSSMERFHKGDLTSYIMILLSIVSSIFEDASIGNSIRISLVNLIMLPKNNDQRHNSSNEMLKHFCTFINRKGYHRDTAMLITRYVQKMVHYNSSKIKDKVFLNTTENPFAVAFRARPATCWVWPNWARFAIPAPAPLSRTQVCPPPSPWPTNWDTCK